MIDGKTPRKKIGETEHNLQHGHLDVALVQTQAGGMGLTMTRSNHAVAGELPWTSIAMRQAFARVHRFTQMRACTADILRAPNCWLENVLTRVISQKQKAADELLSLLTTNI